MKTVLSLLVCLAFVGCGRIETGTVGVRTDFDKHVEMTEMQPGFYTAFLTDVKEYTVQEIEVKFDNLTPKGKDNLSLSDFDVSLWYQPEASQVAEQYVKYSAMSPCGESGMCYPGYNLVLRTAQGVIFDAVAEFDSLTIHTKREQLESRIKQLLQEELDKSDKDVFRITKVVVRQIKTDPKLEESIQAAVQMQKKTEAKELEVKLAQAEARRIVAEAEGQAKANTTLAASLTDQFIRYRQIQAMEQFAGEGTHTVLLPVGGATPLVNVGK